MRAECTVLIVKRGVTDTKRMGFMSLFCRAQCCCAHRFAEFFAKIYRQTLRNLCREKTHLYNFIIYVYLRYMAVVIIDKVSVSNC
jgi:hypothetical protein